MTPQISSFNFTTISTHVDTLNQPFLDQLPQELLEKILFFLNKKDLQATVSVSRSLMHRVQAGASRCELDSIKIFLSFLGNHLKKKGRFSTQISELTKISEKIPP